MEPQCYKVLAVRVGKVTMVCSRACAESVLSHPPIAGAGWSDRWGPAGWQHPIYLATFLTTVSIRICGSQKKGVSDFLLGLSKWMVLYEEYALANYSSANWWKAAAGKVWHANQLMEHVVVSKYRTSRTPNFLLFLALLPAFVVWLPRLFLMLVPALIVILCRAGLNLVLLFLLTPCWFSASDWLTWRLTDWQVEEKESKRCKRSRQIPFIGSKLQSPLTLSA